MSPLGIEAPDLPGYSGLRPLRPEMRLVLECVPPAPEPGVIRDIVREGVDWAESIDLASRHRVASLLYHWCMRSCPEAVPQSAMGQLRSIAASYARQSLRCTGELFRLVDSLAARRIPAITFKGPAIAWSIYLNPSLRPMSDIDVLIQRRDVAAAAEVLAGLGYRAQTPTARIVFHRYGAQLPFQHPNGLAVDLHWHLGPLHFQKWFPDDAVWTRAAHIEIAGRSIRSLAPEDLLRFLCMHAAKHGWDNLRDLGDIARLINSNVDCRAALAAAQHLGGLRPLLVGLALVRDLARGRLPASINDRIAHEPRVPELLAQAKISLLGRFAPDDSPASGLRRYWQLLERPSDRARLCWGVIQPNALDWCWCPLPGPLYAAYFLLKPLRHAAKHFLRNNARSTAVSPQQV